MFTGRYGPGGNDDQFKTLVMQLGHLSHQAGHYIQVEPITAPGEEIGAQLDHQAAGHAGILGTTSFQIPFPLWLIISIERGLDKPELATRWVKAI
jgi:hypothetical protein